MAQTGIKLKKDKEHSSECDEPPTYGVRSFRYDILRGTQAIGWIQGFKINRNKVRRYGDFHLALEADTEECYEFAKTLFEQYSGNLRDKFYNGNAYDRGTGAFGREIDSANFMFIDELVIKQPADRRQGFGSVALTSFLHNSSLSDIPFVFVCPGILSNYMDESHLQGSWDEREKARQLMAIEQEPLMISFFQKNGFRRVGNSDCFAYAKDPSHPSRSIAAASDAPGPPRVRSTTELLAAFPLHARIENARQTSETPAVEVIIASAKLSDFQVRDDYGMTPLHKAAKDGNHILVHAILKRSKVELFAKDVEALTPVELLERAITRIEERGREKMLDLVERREANIDLIYIEKYSKPLALEMRAMMASLPDIVPAADPKPDSEPPVAVPPANHDCPSAAPIPPSHPFPTDQVEHAGGSDSAPAYAADGEEEDPEEEYEIEAILKSKKGYFTSGEMAYFVTWKGYDASHNSWVSESDAGNAAELIAEYWNAQPAKQTATGRKSKAATSPSVGTKDDASSARAGSKRTRLSNSSTAAKAIPTSVAAEDNAKSTQVRMKRTRLSNSTTAVEDSDVPDDANDSPMSKSRKLDGQSSPGQLASPASEEELEGFVASMDAYMHLSSWEGLVDKIVSVGKAPDGSLKAYMELTDGTKAEHESTACRERCPIKLIDFYEKNLRWRENP